MKNGSMLLVAAKWIVRISLLSELKMMSSD